MFAGYTKTKPAPVPAPGRYKATHCCEDPTHVQWWVTKGSQLVAVRATKTAAQRLARELNRGERVVKEDGSITGYEPSDGRETRGE